MYVINNIFYRRSLSVLGVSKCRHSGFECFRPLCCNPCVLFRAYGAAARKSGQRRSYRSCRSCRSGRGGAGRRFWAVVPGGGWRGRTRRNRSVESGAAEVVPGLLFRAAVPGGGGVSDGGAGLAVSGGRAGRRRLCRTVALGGGGVGRWRSRWTEDGETERGWAGGGVGDLLCRMRAVGACPCPCPCPCPCLPANRMSAAEKRRRNLSLPARKRIFEGH